jgi:hypothetical protein
LQLVEVDTARKHLIVHTTHLSAWVYWISPEAMITILAPASLGVEPIVDAIVATARDSHRP